MALKERKQITGTTEQINAYEGHEGQIVWDKEKNTLVGMSGTAGTNYPLATEEALNKKEDAGVCLPLTGGNIRGNITFNNLGGALQATDSDREELLFFAEDSVNNWLGGMLSCRGHKGAITTEHGSFALGARPKDGSSGSYLLGLTSGSLLWRGKEVERVDGFYAAQFEGGYCDVHRYASGLQILTAGFHIPSNQVGITLTFTRPFIDIAYSVAASGYSPNGDVAITFNADTTTSIRFYRKSYSGAFDFTLGVKCIIVGRWL